MTAIKNSNKRIVNRTFEVQIEAIRHADPEKIAYIILQKKVKLNNSKSVAKADTLFAEIDALEWLQRQVVKHLA